MFFLSGKYFYINIIYIKKVHDKIAGSKCKIRVTLYHTDLDAFSFANLITILIGSSSSD
jgi:hypothetical protein